jgi:Ca-activated chloride channel family protein
VTVTQRYVNQEENPIEAVYVFPLEEGSAVCGFEAVLDDTLIVGEVKEREEAFRLYDEAMEAGHGAFLLDEERPDVFQASLGNLLPGKAVVMKLTYVAELQAVDGAVRFAIPTTVSPRYAPAVDTTGVGRPDSETLNPPVAFEVPSGLNLTVRVSNAGRLERIESPSHPIAVTPGADGATVTLSQRDAALDRDFVLSIAAPELKRPIAGVEKEDTARAIAIGFVPELERTSAPAEIVFLIDRSGSMAGTSIVEVRNALQLCLRSMTAGCRFNIVGFGSRTESLFKESRAYDDGSLLEASRHVDAMQADLGGTELLPALELVLSAPPGNLPRQVVVLTDGEVTNTDAVLALASRYAAHARIFTFGIGAGATWSRDWRAPAAAPASSSIPASASKTRSCASSRGCSRRR